MRADACWCLAWKVIPFAGRNLTWVSQRALRDTQFAPLRSLSRGLLPIAARKLLIRLAR